MGGFLSDRPDRRTLLTGIGERRRMNDLELLAEYTRNRSDEAFAAIVERYIRLVHSACWRQMGDAQLAEDATQMVFVLLSRKAASLRHAELAGWLLTTAHYTCANMKRAETRRVRRESVVAMNPTASAVEPNNELLQLLDEGLLRLPADDRQALVARFLRDEPLRQVGEALGLSEDAARKRVERGLDKLRRFFQDRGIATDSAALTAVLEDHSHIPPIAQNLTPRILHAAKTGQPIASAALRAKLALSLSILMSGLLAVTGWGIYQWALRQRVADPVAAAAMAPADPAPQPASLPVNAAPLPDRSTPDKTLASLCRAMLAADVSAAEACILISLDQPTTPLGASFVLGFSHRRLIIAAEKAYGPDGSKVVRHVVPVETVLQDMLVLRQLQGDTADITGNTATISAQIPPAMLQSVPPNIQRILLGWSGKKIYFQLRDGLWHLDIGRSFRFVMQVQRQPNGPFTRAGSKTAFAILQDEVKASDAITAQVAAGRLPALPDAQNALDAAESRICDKYGFTGIQSYMAPAPTTRP